MGLRVSGDISSKSYFGATTVNPRTRHEFTLEVLEAAADTFHSGGCHCLTRRNNASELTRL